MRNPDAECRGHDNADDGPRNRDPAYRKKILGREVQPDTEHQQNDADLSQLLREVYVCHKAECGWADQNACKQVADALCENGASFVVAEQNRELVEQLRTQGLLAVSGDASDPAVLIQAHVVRARLLVIATPDPFQARKMIETARILNPLIETVVRTHSDEEAVLLAKEKVGKVFMGEHELALGMIGYVLERIALAESRASGAMAAH